MEKTVLEQKETYVDSVHRWGRIWGLGLMLLIWHTRLRFP